MAGLQAIGGRATVCPQIRYLGIRERSCRRRYVPSAETFGPVLTHRKGIMRKLDATKVGDEGDEAAFLERLLSALDNGQDARALVYSRAGAKGLTSLMPKAAKLKSGDPHSTRPTELSVVTEKGLSSTMETFPASAMSADGGSATVSVASPNTATPRFRSVQSARSSEEPIQMGLSSASLQIDESQRTYVQDGLKGKTEKVESEHLLTGAPRLPRYPHTSRGRLSKTSGSKPWFISKFVPERVYYFVSSVATRYPWTSTVVGRLPAIVTTLLLELVVSYLITRFAGTIKRNIIITAFTPLLSSISGNVGLQSSASMVKHLTLQLATRGAGGSRNSEVAMSPTPVDGSSNGDDSVNYATDAHTRRMSFKTHRKRQSYTFDDMNDMFDQIESENTALKQGTTSGKQQRNRRLSNKHSPVDNYGPFSGISPDFIETTVDSNGKNRRRSSLGSRDGIEMDEFSFKTPRESRSYNSGYHTVNVNGSEAGQRFSGRGSSSEPRFVRPDSKMDFIRRNAKVIRKECKISISIAVIMSIALFWVSFIFSGMKLVFSLVTGASIMIAVVLAGVLGSSGPLIVASFGLDPTLTAGPFETAVQDLIVNICYLILATLFL